MTIRKKLFWGFGLGVLTIAILGFGGLYARYIITTDFNKIVDFESPSIADLLEFKINAIEAKEEAISIFLFASHGVGDGVEEEKTRLAETDVRFSEFIDDYKTHITPSDTFEADNLKKIQDGWIEFQQAISSVLDLQNFNNSAEETVNADKIIEGSSDKLIAIIDTAISEQNADIANADHDIDNLAKIFLDLTFLAILFAIIFGSLVGYRISKDIVGKLSVFKISARKISEGDLNERVQINSEDELGDLAKSFNAMTAALKYSYVTLEDEVKERTKELADLSKRNETLLISIGDGVIAIDMSWNIIEWNSAAENIVGWSRQEVLGKPFRDYVHFIRARDRIENLVFIQEAMLYGKVKSMENHTLLITKDKREIPVGDSAAPIFDENKKVIGVIIVFRDTSREAASQNLKTDFQYATHQMRTPVTKVLWNIEVAADSENASERNVLLTEAHDAAESIGRMADQLLATSEIDQNIVVPHYEIADAAEIIDKVAQDLKADADKKKIKISVINKVMSNKIETDKILFARCIKELVDNGIKYNKENGEVIIAITEDGPQVIFEIKNTGIGITEEQQPLIFTKFFRGSNYDASKIVGAGIGLFISRSYVNLLKGKIWFKSAASGQTSFFVLLPKLKQ